MDAHLFFLANPTELGSQTPLHKNVRRKSMNLHSTVPCKPSESFADKSGLGNLMLRNPFIKQ
jgi:hypothetical protein